MAFRTLLYAAQHTHTTEIIVLIVGVLLIVFLTSAIYWQRKEGIKLSDELQVLESQRKKDVEFEFVLKAMGLSIWHINTATGDLFFDKDYRQMREDGSMARDDITLSESTDLLVEEDSHRVHKSLNDLCNGNTEYYHEQYRVKIPNSDKYYWEESYAIISERDITGKPTRVVGTTQRIDEQKNMEIALKEALSKAEESDRLKSAFIANMSHEIRTPLNAIIGFTSVLPDIDGREERQEIINLIQENNQKLLRIIDDVMNISKIEAGKEQLQMMTFDVNVILDEVANKYKPKLKPDVTLTTQFAAAEQNITSDLTRVLESMEHLVSNAVKFTDKGNIVISYDPVKNSRIRLWVKDTGKGIAPENQERVFERFFKVDEFIPGAGLGLSVCRTMAFSLGGNVGVESKLGEGSTFWIEIPA